MGNSSDVWKWLMFCQHMTKFIYVFTQNGKRVFPRLNRESKTGKFRHTQSWYVTCILKFSCRFVDWFSRSDLVIHLWSKPGFRQHSIKLQLSIIFWVLYEAGYSMSVLDKRHTRKVLESSTAVWRSWCMTISAGLTWHAWARQVIVIILIHRCLIRTTPRYLAADCVPVSEMTQRRHLRSAAGHQLVMPSYRLNSCGLRAFSAFGPRLWNSLLNCCVHDTSHNRQHYKLWTFFKDIFSLRVLVHTAH